eukprot:8425223-Alexandrium_andersonii.AAC.1
MHMEMKMGMGIRVGMEMKMYNKNEDNVSAGGGGGETANATAIAGVADQLSNARTWSLAVRLGFLAPVLLPLPAPLADWPLATAAAAAASMLAATAALVISRSLVFWPSDSKKPKTCNWPTSARVGM